MSLGNKDKRIDPQKYIFVFVCAVLIFACGFFLANFISKRNLQSIDQLQQNLRIDILSLETQFSILTQAPCENLNESTLTQELYDIALQLTAVGNNVGKDNPYYLQLKKYYSILEIKHWLLLQKAKKECGLPLTFVIYFYADKKTCPSCEDQGYLLTFFRKKYPDLRVYSFDFTLELAALDALKSIYQTQPNEPLPLIIINREVLSGFQNKEQLEKTLGKYIKIEPETEQATSTISTSTGGIDL